MDKRKEENLRVKISITHTLFRLMQTKSWNCSGATSRNVRKGCMRMITSC